MGTYEKACTCTTPEGNIKKMSPKLHAFEEVTSTTCPTLMMLVSEFPSFCFLFQFYVTSVSGPTEERLVSVGDYKGWDVSIIFTK